VAVINHGKDSGNNRMQPRARYLPAVREFLQRGWAVVVPMRQGFSHSGGSAVGEGCNIAANGQAQAEDVRAVVAWLEKQPWADAQRMVMLGQSHGGLTTLAYAQDPHPGFRVFVNFAGGLRYSAGGCPWETELAAAFGRYGARTRVPSLWFYGENDSFFPPAVIGPAHEAYVRAGGPAELVALGPFGLDAHGLFGSYTGLPLWWERVAARLAAAGLPTQVLHPQFSRRAGWMARPAGNG
jgi:dienelactone hydrolase